MMEVTFIEHSGFLVELDHHYLLFDYYKGTIPSLTNKPLYVFASHAHADHYQPIILDLYKEHADTKLILSDDIPVEKRDDITIVKPNQHYQVDDIDITTYTSTDEGVAFLLEVEGRHIYHAGDLNWWHWEDENSAQENEDAKEAYLQEIQKLTGISIDLAFVVLDPRQEEQYFWGLDAFMRIVNPNCVCPMHFWGDFGSIAALKQLPCAETYKDKIMDIHHTEERMNIT